MVTTIHAQKLNPGIHETAYKLILSDKFKDAENLILKKAIDGDIEAQYLISILYKYAVSSSDKIGKKAWANFEFWLSKANSNKWIPSVTTTNIDTLGIQYLSSTTNNWDLVKYNLKSKVGFIEFGESKRDNIIKHAAKNNIYDSQVYYYKNIQKVVKDSSDLFISLLKTAANNDHYIAKADLALFYHNGYYMEKNIDSSIHWYGKYLESGINEYNQDLYSLYEIGKDFENDLEKGLTTYKRFLSISRKNSQEMQEENFLANIGELYLKKEEPKIAIKYYKKALKVNPFTRRTYYYYKLGFLYSKLKKYNKSYYYLQRSDFEEARNLIRELNKR
ncbi:tetratricopeptide repeat protein [Lacihabitans soyangensis]|uniref:tetratricopeptide repeat protein n=1 Tax=Lacihabitans soyangensis TaxID=869394 RepID=UPI0020CBEAD5|nr:hypothetical protein [Lacihabitans soyangensis]